MGSAESDRVSFERLRDAILDDVDKVNVDGVLEKLIVLNEHYKSLLSDDDLAELQKKVNRMIRQELPVPDYSDLILFIVFGFLVALIFGETSPEQKSPWFPATMIDLLYSRLFVDASSTKMDNRIYVIFVLAFFGYKLYRSLTERERRREEKLRAKTQKKKK